MTTVPDWKHCYADPERGVAFFDDVTIEADSINDPRPDRVFPVFRKEQIFMCRQMRPLLDELNRREDGPHAALDVGTGSGVLAIWAARRGGCKVYAVDISERAIEFARHNAEVNHVKVSEYTTWAEFCQADWPGIWLRLVRFDEDFANDTLLAKEALNGGADQDEGCFDLVMLNAPYNPTFPEVTPALHANGGKFGQSEFQAQILQVPRLLRIGGRCAGHHMGVIAPNEEHPNVKAEIESAFHALNERLSASGSLEGGGPGYGASGYYVKVLEEDRKIRTLLEAQYSAYRISLMYKTRVEEYISEVATAWRAFSLLYFSFEKETAKSDGTLLVAMSDRTAVDGRRPLQNKHASWSSWRWETREWLHRCIVEHTASSLSIPWPSLFTPYVPSDQTLSPSPAHSEEMSRRMESSPMRLVDQWLSELPPFHARECQEIPADLPGKCDLPFDFIHLESVPFTPNPDRLPGLQQESAVWFSHHLKTRLTSSEEFAAASFGAWTRCVKQAQKNHVAPFLHPTFMRGASSPPLDETHSSKPPRNWNPVVHSFMRHAQGEGKPQRYPKLPALGQDQTPLHRRFETHFADDIRSGLSPLPEDPESPDPRQATSRLTSEAFPSYYTTSKLRQLDVAEAAAYTKHCTDRINAVEESAPNSSTRHAAELDLEYCHATLHGLAATEFSATVPEASTFRWSYLLSVPLDLSDPLNPEEEGVLPSTYRGGIFLFVASLTEHWKPWHDRLVFDLARFAAILYNGRFNVVEARSQTFDVFKTMVASLSHEMSGHTVALNTTLVPISEVFDLSDHDGAPSRQAKWEPPAGRILAPHSDIPTIGSWLVCPTPRVSEGLENTLAIWSSSQRWLNEQDWQCDRRFEEVFQELITFVVRSTATTRRVGQKNLPTNLAQVRALHTDLDTTKEKLLQHLEPGVSLCHDGAETLVWVKPGNDTARHFAFIRITASAVANAVKNILTFPPCDFGLQASATLSNDNTQIRIKILNYFEYTEPARTEKPWGTKRVIETLIRDCWGLRVVEFRDLDVGRDDLKDHRWLTSFMVPITVWQGDWRQPWLRLT